jgi:N-acetylneuraminic acid mutarotase
MRWSQPLCYANTSTTETSSPNNASSSTVIANPTITNHSVTYYNNYLYCFGGYDGRRNHSSLLLYDVTSQTWSIPCNVAGTVPPGRNGHTSTLARDQIIILGGWLGSGPLAASDLHVLDVSEGPERLRWYQPRAQGTPPGPCNMHSADYIPHIHSIFVFRGGDGTQYLNDLHSLDCSSFTWNQIQSNGAIPQARANHCSAVLVETRELVIFGGWNGRERLNDVHILNVDTLTWTKPDISGELPHPRAGMTLTACRDRLFLFGGSGTSSKCFNDLQILDRKELRWLDVNKDSASSITIIGRGPGRRAGHSSTAVNRYIYVFGGSCGADYLSDFFVLDTDPPLTT